MEFGFDFARLQVVSLSPSARILCQSVMGGNDGTKLFRFAVALDDRVFTFTARRDWVRDSSGQVIRDGKFVHGIAWRGVRPVPHVLDYKTGSRFSSNVVYPGAEAEFRTLATSLLSVNVTLAQSPTVRIIEFVEFPKEIVFTSDDMNVH